MYVIQAAQCTVYKLLYQLFSEMHITFSGGGVADNTTQLNKVNKGRQKRRILEKIIICIINMYQLLVA